MYRFIPTPSGELHMGHLASLCLINYLAKLDNSEVVFVIDDMQVRYWNLYPKDLSEDKINENCESITNVIHQIFPNVKPYGRFSDKMFSEQANKKFLEVDHSVVVKEGMLYCIPKSHLSYSSNRVPIFDSLRSFFKINLNNKNNKLPCEKIIWNPFFFHEVVDQYLNTTCQVVDDFIYCPYRYLHDDHVYPMDLYAFWRNVISGKAYDIFLHPRLVDLFGNPISKRGSDCRFSLEPIGSVWDRAEKCFSKRTPEEIGKWLYELAITENRPSTYRLGA